MSNKFKRYGIYTAAAGMLLSVSLFSGCSNSPDLPTSTVSYGPEIGLADGSVDLSGDSPVINISDIKSHVGENIDFLSGVSVENEDDYADLEIWADASEVDIFTPGDYTATYTFKYNGKSISKEITVTIVEAETEQSASEFVAEQSTADGNGSSGTQKPSTSATTGNSSGNKTTAGNNTTTANTADNQTSANATTTGKTGGNSGNSTTTAATTKNNSTTRQNTTTKNSSSSQSQTTTRQIVTTSGNKTTENKNIGNYTIELLSGKTITIRNTTSKYIVSTRTDVSTVTKNGKNYRVSTLIIKFNTGSEQILETVEERIK